jgi:hypothetical protein
LVHTSQAIAVAEAAEKVIKLTARAYVSEPRSRKELEDCHVGEVRQLSEQIKAVRHQYAHATSESWAVGLTEEGL